MALNIKNAATEAAIRRLAACEGVSLTEAVDRAVHAKLSALEPLRAEKRAFDVDAIVAMIDRMRGDDRSPIPDHGLLYDDKGLPI